MLTETLNQALSVTDAGPAIGAWLELGDRIDAVGFQLVTTGSLTGSWVIESSNVPLASLPDATPSDVTAAFSTPAGAAVAAVTAASSQGVQCTTKLAAGRVRAKFVKTGGSGSVRIDVRN